MSDKELNPLDDISEDAWRLLVEIKRHLIEFKACREKLNFNFTDEHKELIKNNMLEIDLRSDGDIMWFRVDISELGYDKLLPYLRDNWNKFPDVADYYDRYNR